MANLTPERVLDLLNKSGTGYQSKESDLFQPGNVIIAHSYRRQGVIMPEPKEDDEQDQGQSKEISCNVPGCYTTFQSVPAFESHYNSLHRFNCAQCKKNLPSAHLLDLHLEENHDSYFEVLCQRKASYRCFIDNCKDRFWTPTERREHSIEQHKLPKSFKFVTKERKREIKGERMEDDQPVAVEVKKETTESAPKNVTFGHNVPKAFDISYAKELTKNLRKKKKKAAGTALEDEKMVVDLLESLPQ